MADPATVANSAANAQSASVEQAVFTSVRSATGRGYRIVAASSGLSADEKREIVQCAPSHGSLCDPSPTATALASFALRSGRRCLFLVRHAGVEHSARGGYRVHTHVLVADQATFRRFACDPLRIEAAASRFVSVDSLAELPKRLEPCSLSVAGDELCRKPARSGISSAGHDIERALELLSLVLGGDRVLVTGVPTPGDVLRLVLGATPMFLRQGLSLSCGLRFAPARPFQLVFAEADRAMLEAVRRERDVVIFSWSSPPSGRESAFDAWLRFVRQRWQCGRYADLERLAAQLTCKATPTTLAQIAALCQDTDRVRQADRRTLEQLALRYADACAECEAHRQLLAAFGRAVQLRRASLAVAAEESES